MWTKRHFRLVAGIILMTSMLGTRWLIKYGILFAGTYMCLGFTGFPALIPILVWIYFRGLMSFSATFWYLNRCLELVTSPVEERMMTYSEAMTQGPPPDA